MVDEQSNWLDDAFADEANTPAAPASAQRAGDTYDWIDDAFDESKRDPLERKGMTGCSAAAVAIIAIVIIGAVAVFALSGLVFSAMQGAAYALPAA